MIKLFEEYKDTSMDDYYQEISKEEYESIRKLEYVVFTSKEHEILRNIASGFWWCSHSWEFYSERIYDVSFPYMRILIRGRDRCVCIDKLKDEWYYVQFNKPIGIGRRKRYIEKWYKCDQWEGLIKFLKSL